MIKINYLRYATSLKHRKWTDNLTKNTYLILTATVQTSRARKKAQIQDISIKKTVDSPQITFMTLIIVTDLKFLSLICMGRRIEQNFINVEQLGFSPRDPFKITKTTLLAYVLIESLDNFLCIIETLHFFGFWIIRKILIKSWAMRL